MIEDNHINKQFKIIDYGIENFNQDKGFRVDTDAKSDWLIFDWRQITWAVNCIRYLIEVYPHFDTDENIESWSLYTAASIDIDDKRYWILKVFADKVELSFIAQNIDVLLFEAYRYVIHLTKDEILASGSDD